MKRQRLIPPLRGRLLGRRPAESESVTPVPTDRIQGLEQRVAHLEAMVEGLQDGVHREATRTKAEIDELRRRTEPAEMSQALSRDARRRGLG